MPTRDRSTDLGKRKKIKGQWTLRKPVISLGRRVDNDVVVRVRWVSRTHARITNSGERHVIQDLGSRNGTHVNGQRIAESTALGNGADIRLARTARLAYLTPQSADHPPLDAHSRSLESEPERHCVRLCGALLTPPLLHAQFTLLALLVEKAGRVYSRGEIISAVRPSDDAVGISDRAMNALGRRTRLRLRELDPNREYIVTVRGQGFKLEANHGLESHRA